MRVKGYTLIEILVVLTVIGILFGVGYASYRNFSRRQNLVGLAKQIEGDLRLAQQMAMSGEKPAECDGYPLQGVRFGITTSSPFNYKIRTVCGPNPNDLPVIKEYYFPDGISFDFTNFQTNPVIFKVLGEGTNIPSGATDQLIIKDQFGNTATITIDSGGSIR